MDYHTPVLLEEVVKLLNPAPGKVFLDGTLGHGGHTLALLEKGAQVYGLDQDPESLKIASARIQEYGYSDNFHPIHGNFSSLPQLSDFDGLLIDLGLNSFQQKAIGRGFSFNDHQSLDMRLDPTSQEETAEFIINTYDFQELFDIFTKYAQEQYSKPLIIRIIAERQKSPIKSGQRLADIIRQYYKEKHLRSAVDPATKIFLALRIAVNHELDHLKVVLSQTINLVKTSGTVCVISFHSGEDRLVKNFIQQQRALGAIEVLTPKGIRPSQKEIKVNPLSRSAVLRSYRII